MSNTLTRVLVSVVAIPLIVLLCWMGKIPFLILVLFIGLLSYYEFSVMLKSKNMNVNLPIGYGIGMIMILNTYFQLLPFMVLMFLSIVVLLAWELFRNYESAISNIGGTLLALFYPIFFISFLIPIRELYSGYPLLYDRGGFLIISIIATIWLCDSAAFFFGVAFGKHKIFKRVSPKKSWEGSISGFIFSIIAMVVFKYTLVDFLTWNQAIGIGITVGVFGQMGDFVESLIKRDANVKDSSDLIPGHGGVLDRFDSMFFVAPLVYLLMIYVK